VTCVRRISVTLKNTVLETCQARLFSFSFLFFRALESDHGAHNRMIDGDGADAIAAGDEFTLPRRRAAKNEAPEVPSPVIAANSARG